MAKYSIVHVEIDAARGVDKSLRKFKRLCEAYGVYKEYRQRQEYKKPSVRKKEKLESAVKRRSKLEKKSRGGRKKI